MGMNMNRIAVSLIFVLFSAQSSNSQSNMYYEIGAGISFSGGSNKILEDHRMGLTFAASISRKVIDNIQILLNVGYNRYYYSGKVSPLIAPRPYVQSINGKPGNVYEINIGSRYFLDTSRVGSFFQLNMGTMLTRDGEILIKQWYIDRPEIYWEIIYKRGGTYYLDAYFSLGYGYSIPISKSVNVIPHANFQLSLNRKEVYFPFKLHVQLPLR